MVFIMTYLFVTDASLTGKRFTTTTVQLNKCEPLQKLRVRLCKMDLSPPAILYSVVVLFNCFVFLSFIFYALCVFSYL